MKMKTCCRCGRTLILVYFGRSTSQKDHYDTMCRECRREDRLRQALRKEEFYKELELGRVEQEKQLEGLRKLAANIVPEEELYPSWFRYDTYNKKLKDFKRIIFDKLELQEEECKCG